MKTYENIELYNGDCLDIMKQIPTGSVDLVLTDPPYGTIKGLNDRVEWDVIVPIKPMFEEISRVLRKNGRCILFSQEPLTSSLICNQIVHLPFSYRAVWVKNKTGNAMSCKSAMVNMFEDICVFQNKCPNRENSEAAVKFQSCVGKYGKNHIAELMFKEGRYKNLSSAKKNLSKKLINDYSEKDYDNFFDRKMLTFLSQHIDLGFSIDWYIDKAEEYKRKYAPTFNLQGAKIKLNVLSYRKDTERYHPTQKPVKLLEDLILTFSKEGDTVLDFTMGSGSTGVACMNTNRKFTGIELDENYYNIAEKRINEAMQNIQPSLFD